MVGTTSTKVQPAQNQRKNNSKACQRCREKRARCDGFFPSEAHPDGKECSSCTASGYKCKWSDSADKRRTVSRHDYEQLNELIRGQKQQIEILRDRLRANDLSDELPTSLVEESEPSETNDTLETGFQNLVLEEGGVLFYGVTSPFSENPRPNPNKSKLSALQGVQHSTSRLPELNLKYKLQTSTDSPQDGNTCWDMYLARDDDGKPLLTRMEHDIALDRFFRFFCSWTMRIIPHFFLRDLDIATTSPDPKPPTDHFSPMLHNIMLATALSYSDNPALKERSLRERFIAQGKNCLDGEARRPALSGVQSLALLSSYYSGQAEQSLGFMYFGMAIRLAQALGLHVRIPDGGINNDARIERNWVFWSIFVQDKTWSFYVGRNQGLHESDVDIRPPQIDRYMDNQSWEWNTVNGIPIEQPALQSSTFSEVVKLMQIASKILTVVYDLHLASKLAWKSGQITAVYHDLREWRNRLAENLYIETPATTLSPPHIIMLNLTFEWMRLLLLRTFYQPEIHSSTFAQQVEQLDSLMPSSPTSPGSNGFPRLPEGARSESVKKLYELGKDECPKAAARVLELINAYERLFTLRFAPMTVVQIAYIAGKTLMRAVSAGSTTRQGVSQRSILAGRKAREQVRECFRCLRAVGETWPSGNITAELLEKELETEIQNQAMLEMQANGERAPKRKSTSPLPDMPMARPKFRPMTLDANGEALTGIHPEMLVHGDSPVTSNGPSPPATGDYPSSTAAGPSMASSSNPNSRSTASRNRPTSQPMGPSSSGGGSSTSNSASPSFVPPHFVPNTFDTSFNGYYAESPMWNIRNQSAPFLIRDQYIVDPNTFSAVNGPMYQMMSGMPGTGFSSSPPNGAAPGTATGTAPIPLQSSGPITQAVPGGIVQNVFIQTPHALHSQVPGGAAGGSQYVYAGSTVSSMPPSMGGGPTNGMMPVPGASRASNHPGPRPHSHSFNQGTRAQPQQIPMFQPPSGPPSHQNPSHSNQTHTHSHSFTSSTTSVFEPTSVDFWSTPGDALANMGPQMGGFTIGSVPSDGVTLGMHSISSVSSEFESLVPGDASWMDHSSSLEGFPLGTPEGGLGTGHWG